MTERAAPHNVDVEQALLGAIFFNNDAMHRVNHFLRPAHFYEAIHGKIFEVCQKLIEAGKVATPQTVQTFMPTEFLPDMTMAQYLARLSANATTILNVTDFGRLIHDAATRRALLTMTVELSEAVYDADIDVPVKQLIEDAEKTLYEIAETGQEQTGFQGFNKALTVAVAVAAAAYQRDGSLSGQSTGLMDLDRLMGGLQRSDLIIIAARPAMGKTALATNIAFHVAKHFRADVAADGAVNVIDGGRVAFFSLEMSSEQLATRILAEQAGIPSSVIRRGEIHEGQFGAIVDISSTLSNLPLFIDDTGGLSIGQLAARARRLKRQKGVDLIVVDYLQLLSGSSRRSAENRVQELTEITTRLKALAKELDVPVIALSQLSRAVESREDKHPQLSDLRESGSIEQDADVVLFVYREEYYLRNKEPEEGTPEHLKWQEVMARAHGRAEVIIGKQRHGPTGTVQLHFDANLTRFRNLAREQYLPERAA